jgi:hypothetical protein
MWERDSLDEEITVDSFIQNLLLLKKDFNPDEGTEKQLDELYLSCILDFLVLYSAQEDKFSFLRELLLKIANNPGMII